MKKFISRHLSVFLSLAIILGTILPVLSGIIGVSALSDEENAIENLKKEWEALSSLHNPDINPNRWWNASGAVGGTGMAEGSSFAETLPDGVDLGAYYAVFSGLGDTAILSSRQCVLYEFCKDGNGTGIIPGAKSTVNINKMDDIYFWVRVENANKDAALKIQVMTNTGSAKTYNLPEFAIPVSKSGEWVKVSLKEIGGNAWYGALNQELYRVMIAFSDVGGATVTMGAGKIVISGTCPLPENTSEWGADEWLNAAKTVDRSLYIDTAAFDNAVVALKAFSSIDPNVEILAEEWAKLEYNPTPIYEGFRVFYFKDSNGTAYKNTNTGATQLIYDTNVDTAYGFYQFTGTGIINSPASVIGYNMDGDTPSAYTLTQLEDIYFWYKSTGQIELRIELAGYNGSDKYSYIAAQTGVVLTGDNSWHKLSVKDAFGANWGAFLTTKGNYNLTRVTINAAANGQSVASVNTTFGGLYFELEDTSLNGSASWTNEQWVDNARALDLSDYSNTAAFEAALLAALESVYGITEADLAAAELITVWGEMTQKDKYNVLPNRWWNQSGTFGYTNMAVAASYTDILPESVELGNKFFKAENLGASGALGSKQCILYEFLDGTDRAYGSTDKTPYSIRSIEDIYFWVKFDNLTTDATLTIQLATNDNGAKYATLPAHIISSEKSGEWVKISAKEIGGENWQGNLSEIFYRFQLSISNVSGASFQTGSAIIEKEVGAPEGAANMEAIEILEAAMALDLSSYGNTKAFEEKLEALKLLCEEQVAIAGLKKATENLYANSGEYLYGRRYFNDEGVLSAADAYVTDTASYMGNLPEGADATNIKSYLGNKMAVFSDLSDIAAAYKTSGNKQTVLYEFEGGSRSAFTAGQIKDMYFWYKLEGAASAKIINGIFVIGADENAIPTKLGGEITLIGDGQWHKVTFSEEYGTDWVSDHTLYDGAVYRMLMSIGEAQGGTITLGSIVTEATAGLLPKGNDSWNLSDWIYEISKIDYEKYSGAEAFKEALDYAVDVRDRLSIGRGTNVSTYDDNKTADADLTNVIGRNVLEGLVPTIYHSADGNAKNEVSSVAPELFTDGNNTTVGVVSGLDNTNEASFTQFIYRFKGEAEISDFFIYNDNANIADKYYIYVANSQSDLFLQENLLVPFTNDEGKLVQRFNFDDKPDVSGNFLGIRVFGNSNTVSFAEIVAMGDVVTYDLEKGKFSNDRIAELGNNILVDKEPKIKAGVKFAWSDFMAKQYIPQALVDNNNSTGAAVYGNYVISEKDDTISIHFYYDLGTTYAIEKLFVNNWDNKGLETGKYEVYASNDVNSLFMSRSMILSYDNTKEGGNGTTVSQLFTLKNEVVARFVSFHITYPISDWDYCETRENYNKLYGIRLSELGVYGTEWIKPYALVNLTSHVPMDVYRTDANGKQTKVEESEYSGSEHKYTYDGNDATVADIKIKNGEKLDFVYNLAAEMTLEEICMKLGVGSVKKMNIYASTVKDSIWDSSSLIYSANDALGETYFGKGYAGSPIKARYIRFEILENEGEDLIINELEAIGGNDQEFNYMNLIEEKPESASFYLQDKDTGLFAGTTEYGNKWLPSWTDWSKQYPFQKAFDNDYDSVYDIFAGKNGEESVSFLFDFGTLNAIDSITLVGGSYDAYWPDELNIYFGESDVALMEKDAKPAKAWKRSVEDGFYIYEFVPQVAQYVRIEIVRAENEVYSQYSDRIVAVISEFRINGLELRSRAVNGIAASFVDEATGIKAEVLALSENDVFDKIQDILVVKRDATDDELASAKRQSLETATDLYDIYFIDVNGDIVTDADGREVVIYLPETLCSVSEDIFVLRSEFGGLSMIEFDSADGYYYFTIDDISSALNVALGYMVEDEEVFDDTDDSDFEDTDDEFDEDENDEDEDEDDDNLKRKKKIKVVRKAKGDNDYLWIILAICAGVVVIAAAVVLIIVLKKKKEKESEE